MPIATPTHALFSIPFWVGFRVGGTNLIHAHASAASQLKCDRGLKPLQRYNRAISRVRIVPLIAEKAEV